MVLGRLSRKSKCGFGLFDREEEIIASFARRLQRAQIGRNDLIREQGLTGYRLVAAESDGLPGITIDRYANVLRVSY